MMTLTVLILASLLSVIRVVDGDTVKLEFVGTVRLVGIDTPETVHPRQPVQCYGPEASAFLKGLLYKREVGVELTGFDRYQRSLGFIYLGRYYPGRDDGIYSINALMIELGYARAETRFPHQYMEEFVRLEEEAKKAKRGLWGKCQNANEKNEKA